VSLPALTPATVLTQAPEIVEVDVGGALVLYEPSGDRFVRLNQTAAELWRALAQPIGLDELARGLTDMYGIDAPAAARDAAALVGPLIAREMVAVVSPGG
jgi:Coenzyme PQQ synthesis protein D (PqqD)